jgi:hypothetical protein
VLVMRVLLAVSRGSPMLANLSRVCVERRDKVCVEGCWQCSPWPCRDQQVLLQVSWRPVPTVGAVKQLPSSRQHTMTAAQQCWPGASAHVHVGTTRAWQQPWLLPPHSSAPVCAPRLHASQ